jgi:hypothetical protein
LQPARADIAVNMAVQNAGGPLPVGAGLKPARAGFAINPAIYRSLTGDGRIERA